MPSLTRAMVVEDDHYQLERISETLRAVAPGLDIHVCSTAIDAIDAVNGGIVDSVNVCVVDRLLRWCEVGDPRAEVEAPYGLERGSAVLVAIRKRARLRDIPIIVLSINTTAIPQYLELGNVQLVEKSADLEAFSQAVGSIAHG